MRVRLLPAYEYQRMRWKNGLGWTREIARSPRDGDHWDWRVSIAEIDHDCPFSAFPSCRRSLVLLEGNGMQLRFESGRDVELQPPHGRIDFSGDEPLDCVLLDGPTRDFNLMYRPDAVDATLHHRPLVGSMVFFPEPGVQWLIYLLSGHARLKGYADIALAAGDSLFLEGDTAGERALLDGAGEVLLVKIARKDAS